MLVVNENVFVNWRRRVTLEVIILVNVKEFVRDLVNDTNWFVTLDRVNELVINLTLVKRV